MRSWSKRSYDIAEPHNNLHINYTIHLVFISYFEITTFSKKKKKNGSVPWVCKTRERQRVSVPGEWGRGVWRSPTSKATGAGSV